MVPNKWCQAPFCTEGEAGINGARPHFLYGNVLFFTKWGLAPFIWWHHLFFTKWGLAPFILAPFILAPFIRWGKSNVFLNHVA